MTAEIVAVFPPGVVVASLGARRPRVEAGGSPPRRCATESSSMPKLDILCGIRYRIVSGFVCCEGRVAHDTEDVCYELA